MSGNRATPIVLLIALAGGALLWVDGPGSWVLAQQSGSEDPAPTAQMPMPNEYSPDQVSSLYEQLLDTSLSNLETVKWMNSVAVAVIALSVAVLGGITIYRSKQAEDKANAVHVMALSAEARLGTAEEKANHAETVVRGLDVGVARLDCQVEQAGKQIETAAQQAHDAETLVKGLHREVEKAKAELQELDKEADLLRNSLAIVDQKDFRLLQVYRQVDLHRKGLYEPVDEAARQRAEWFLVEKLKSRNPIIRKESVQALSGLSEPGADVLKEFAARARDEQDLQIRRLIQEALDRWQAGSG